MLAWLWLSLLQSYVVDTAMESPERAAVLVTNLHMLQLPFASERLQEIFPPNARLSDAAGFRSMRDLIQPVYWYGNDVLHAWVNSPARRSGFMPILWVLVSTLHIT